MPDDPPEERTPEAAATEVLAERIESVQATVEMIKWGGTIAVGIFGIAAAVLIGGGGYLVAKTTSMDKEIALITQSTQTISEDVGEIKADIKTIKTDIGDLQVDVAEMRGSMGLPERPPEKSGTLMPQDVPSVGHDGEPNYPQTMPAPTGNNYNVTPLKSE